MYLMYGLVSYFFVFFFKQKTAYEMRISDWSSDVCSSDLEQVEDAEHDEGGQDRGGIAVRHGHQEHELQHAQAPWRVGQEGRGEGREEDAEDDEEAGIAVAR